MGKLFDKRDFLRLLSSAAVAAPTAIVSSKMTQSNADAAAHKMSTYERVMKTRTLRCAYADYQPLMIVDANTKKLSGVYYDLIEEIGRRLDIKIEWAEEVGYGNINAGFIAGRYDAFCSPLWPNSLRAKVSAFTQPLYYSPVFMWARANDGRFDNNLEKLNDSAYTISMIDGDVTQAIAEKDFPRAKHLSATQSSTVAEEAENVLSGKADAFAAELISAQHYMQHNPGTLRNASPEAPIRVYGNVIMLSFGENDLKILLDNVIDEMRAEGTIEHTIKKYAGDHPPFYFVGKPYEVKAP